MLGCHIMKLSDIDLNLFVVLDAIYTEGNLTRAGEIIGLSLIHI